MSLPRASSEFVTVIYFGALLPLVASPLVASHMSLGYAMADDSALEWNADQR